ncbi:MAG: cytochrome c biogenesis protein ResB [Coriobacteriia bacterium]|jgi:hypothetical protein
MSRIWRFLRSRTLALWTIVAFSVYSAVATTLSDGDWSVPYTHPIFVAIAALLAASTAACAWERTRAAIRNLRPPAAPSSAALEQLRTRPRFTVPVASSGDALAKAESALRSLRLRVTRSGDVLEARGGLFGALGSSVFHWSLVLLFVVIVLGQITRAEGLMGVVSGYSKPDSPESYGHLEAGSLAGDLSGRIIAVPRMEDEFTANGVEQGVTPYVEIRSADGGVLASGHAYANHPIRYRSMLVHNNDNGLAAIATVSAQGEVFQQEVLLDYTADRSGVAPSGFEVVGPDGQPLAVAVFDVPEDGTSTLESPAVRVRAGGAGWSPDAPAEVDSVLRVGESVTLPGEVALTIADLTKYARLSVVDDWSVYYIYTLFVLGMLGLTFALFTPYRAVRATVVIGDGAAHLAVTARHGRGDPHFPGKVVSALRDALDARGNIE